MTHPLPQNWQFEKLGNVADVITGSTPSTRIPEYYGNDYLFVSPADLKSKYVKSSNKKLSLSGFDQCRKIPKGAVLFTCIGSTIGKVGISAKELATNQQINSVIGIDANTDFLYYQLLLRASQIKLMAGTQAVPIISKSLFESVDISLPPRSEQQRIVTILETWDKAIEKLDRKIELKKNVKKGLMQKLLTGKKRLPGFSGEWNKVVLSEIGDVRTSSVDKKIADGQQEIRLLNYMDVYRRNKIKNEDSFQNVTAKESQIMSSNLKKGDILFTPSSETPDDIGHSAVVVEDLDNVLFSYHLVRLRPKKQYLSCELSAYCFRAHYFYRQLWKRATGATRYTISKSDLEESYVFIPESLDEQRAIAQVLTINSNEIEMLEKKLYLFKSQKTYLLNYLITGRIRTPENMSVPTS